jgi:hypothetical protein
VRCCFCGVSVVIKLYEYEKAHISTLSLRKLFLKQSQSLVSVQSEKNRKCGEAEEVSSCLKNVH